MSQLQLATLRVESFEDLRRALDGADTRSVPLGSRVPRGSIVHAAAGDVLLTAGQWSADIRTRGSVTAERIALGVKLDSESRHFSFRSGREVFPGDVYVLVRGDDVDHRVSGSIRYAFVSMRPELLLNQAGEDAWRESAGFWEKRRWFCASPPIRGLIARSLQTLVMEVLRSDRLLTEPALRQLQVELIEPFLWGFMFDESRREERHTLSGAAIVRSVEDWVDGQSPEMIQLADLCRALRVSRRTLQRAFTEVLGMGPARYLALKRLAAVRAELRESDPAATTVTDTALRYGFWELGRFARDYRRTFGESPSETLSKGTQRGARGR
ncbi:MAG TPA: helix-turn-helix domain-containing protein [Steroidobacteraceae bacterium]|nr:helix-turn-helix domain-containing protein [Steroidobacteraceae bacterium]